MASNQNKGTQGGTPEQHAAAGRQSHKNDANKQSVSGSGSRSGSTAGSGAGTRGGTPEQHAAAGRQSHKNDGNKQSGSGSGSRSGSSSGNSMRSDASEQNLELGRQSSKGSKSKR